MYKTLVLSLLLLSFLPSFAQKVNIYCNDDSCKISAQVLIPPSEYIIYDLGEPHGSYVVYRIIHGHTSLLFTSFGCSQYSVIDNVLSWYSWVDTYEYYCLCIVESETPCRGDTARSHIKVQYQYIDNQPVCSVNHFDYWATDMHEKFIEENLRYYEDYHLPILKNEKFITLSKKKKQSQNEEYEYIRHHSAYSFLNNDVVDKFYNTLIFSLMIDSDLCTKLCHNLLFLVDNDDDFLTRLRVYLYDFINYYYNLSRYLAPMQGKTFRGKEINTFAKNMTTLYSNSYGKTIQKRMKTAQDRFERKEDAAEKQRFYDFNKKNRKSSR